MQNDYYVYVYLNQLKNGSWKYENHEFIYQPFYVGKGRNKRDIVHLCPFMLKQHNVKNSTIKSIMNQCGELPIHYRIYTGLTNSEAIRIEIDIIKTFGRKDNNTGILSNCTDGGDGANNFSIKTIINTKRNKRKIYQYSMNGTFVKEWESLTSIGVEFSNPSNISTAIKRNGSYCGYLWSYEKYDKVNPKIKYQMPIKYFNIKQIDIKSQKVISIFTTALDAERTLNLRVGARNKILECVKGKIKTYIGYDWKI